MELLDKYLPFFPLLIIAVVASLFVYIYRGSKKHDPIEAGLTPLFEEQAGGRFGISNLTYPFVRHAIYDDFVVISTSRRFYKLGFDQIKKIDVGRHMFSVGVTYHHNVQEVPSKLIVWSTNPGFVESLLRSKGVKT